MHFLQVVSRVLATLHCEGSLVSDHPRATSNLPAVREVSKIGGRTREWTVAHPALASGGISLAGISHARKGFRFETQGWAFAQILLCHGGEGLVRVRDRWCKCGKGSVYLNPAGIPHAYRAVNDEPWKLCWLVYQAPFQKTPLAGIDHAALLSVDARPLKSAISGFRHESVGNADPVVLRAWADLISLTSMRVNQDSANAGRLWKVWDEVSADLSHHWTCADMAGLINVSEEHLRRLCQERLGCAPMEYVSQLRMRKAAVLLRTSDQKIDTIAEQVAYADRFGFSAAFRRHFGSSPAQYRREGENCRDQGASNGRHLNGNTPSQPVKTEYAGVAMNPLDNPGLKVKLDKLRSLRTQTKN